MQPTIDYTLLASAPTLRMLQDAIGTYFYSKNIQIVETPNPKSWDVHNANGLMQGYRVIQKGKRFRFESVD